MKTVKILIWVIIIILLGSGVYYVYLRTLSARKGKHHKQAEVMLPAGKTDEGLDFYELGLNKVEGDVGAELDFNLRLANNNRDIYRVWDIPADSTGNLALPVFIYLFDKNEQLLGELSAKVSWQLKEMASGAETEVSGSSTDSEILAVYKEAARAEMSIPALASSRPNDSAAPDSTERGTGSGGTSGVQRIIEKEPTILTQTDPEYPALAQKRGISGTVLLDVEVLANGTAGRTRVVRSVSPELDKSAQDCVQGWTFTPAQSGGEKVAYWITVPVEFVKP